jgi:glycyl-tRNA synthetase beta chain
MTTTKNLLVELLVEELPPKSLKKLGEVFSQNLLRSLIDRNLTNTSALAIPYASPRRLAVHISNVAATAPDKELTEKLMPVSIAIGPDGKSTDALRKRLAKIGRERLADLWPATEDGPDRLFVQSDGKADSVFLRSLAKGASLQVGLEFAVEEALAALPILKVMTYQLADGWNTVNFVRPAHGLVALHGKEIMPIEILGLKAGRETQGHRFEASVAKVKLKDADSYETQMENEGAVIPSFEKRRAEIAKQLSTAAAKEGLKQIEDEALLDEVTALVERPNVLVGKFEKEFLEVPQECLILTMKANQKYFPLLDANGRLTNKFLIVSNIRPADPSLVIGGNERVVRPRLADAKFFFDKDRKQPLDSRVLGLAKVVYHNKLGTQGERVQRVQAIARAIGQQLGGDALAAQADQAALLAKADLLTDMVGEFPELQGIMGRYYAQHDGLNDDIAFAIEDHYKPRFAGDELPRNMVGICVALADKLEILVGMFEIGQIPTGDKDPFALRRHALGVIRMLIEHDLRLDVEWLMRISLEQFNFLRTGNASMQFGYNKVILVEFIYERLAGSMRDQGYSAQEVDAVEELRPQRLGDIPKRLAAVRTFAALPEAAALAAANKRVGNILKKEGIGANVDAVNSKLLKEPAEQALHQALCKIAPKADAAFTAGDYAASLQALAALRVPVDDFFDNVMVNAQDAALRTNRLALLSQLHQAMNRVADISKLAT